MKIRLNESAFTDRETLFADAGELKAYLFRYESGICAVKIENEKGYITVLPFDGQMVWDAVFCGRSLKMETSFDMPRRRGIFQGYLRLLYHALRRAGDGVPLAGGRSRASRRASVWVRYDCAFLVSGEDEKGRYMGVTGEYEYNRAFGSHYMARPVAKVYGGSTLIDVGIEIENKAAHPMDLMYMCHVNNAPEVGAEIYQTLPWTPENMVVRVSIPQYNEPDPAFMELLDRVQQDVSVTRVIGPEDVYDPEIVLFLRGVKGDEDGKAHFLYVHKDGSADYTTYDAAVLNRGVRWMVNHDDWKSMGMVLPATAEPEGYIAEKKKETCVSCPEKKRSARTLRSAISRRAKRSR